MTVIMIVLVLVTQAELLALLGILAVGMGLLGGRRRSEPEETPEEETPEERELREQEQRHERNAMFMLRQMAAYDLNMAKNANREGKE